jgi:coenzyme A diphosphatase NUDT7
MVPYANRSLDPVEEGIGGGDGRYYQYRDVSWGEPGQKVRMHRFLTGREGGGVKPVYGLTAFVLS